MEEEEKDILNNAHFPDKVATLQILPVTEGHLPIKTKTIWQGQISSHVGRIYKFIRGITSGAGSCSSLIIGNVQNQLSQRNIPLERRHIRGIKT